MVRPSRWSRQGCAWQQGEQVPDVLAAACRQLELPLRAGAWAELEELQRFALVKLSHPGHEHRNLPRALQEFGAVATANPEATAQ